MYIHNSNYWHDHIYKLPHDAELLKLVGYNNYISDYKDLYSLLSLNEVQQEIVKMLLITYSA